MINPALRPSAAGSAWALSMYLLACLLAAGYAAAEESGLADSEASRPRRFGIAPQRLESALTLFSEATGYSVLIGGELVRDRLSPGVQGEWPPPQALQVLLQGTGLSARFIGSKAFTLVRETAAASASAHGDADGAVPMAAAQIAGDDFLFALQGAITRALCLAQPDSFGRYRLGLQLWLTPSGVIWQVQLLASSGSALRDRQVQASLRNVDIGRPPPSGLPQPLTVLLRPRADPDADCRYFADAGR